MVQKTDQFGFIKGDSEFNRKRLEDIIKNLNIATDLKDGINVPSEQTDNFINQANQFGVSGTNMNALGFGGLSKFIPQAQNIYTQLLSKSPDQQAKEDRINTGLLLTLYLLLQKNLQKCLEVIYLYSKNKHHLNLILMND
jgi:mevalonate kinase